MADIFNTQGNKATQAVIDAASKILMGVNDDETAKAQTEEEHPAIDPKNQEDVQEAKKKAKKSDEEENLDSPGEEDGDVDNDGDSDQSDAFLMKKRKAIKKAMTKEGVELPDYVIEAIEEVLAEDPDFQLDEMLPMMVVPAVKIGKKVYKNINKPNMPKAKKPMPKAMPKRPMKEAEDLDADGASKALTHDCAKHVVHKEHGEGQCVPGMHTLEEDEDNPGTGYVTHYDVMFGDSIVEDVPVEELEIVSENHHGHMKKKK